MDTIWILDDDLGQARSLERLLAKLGYNVTVFSDSQQLESAVNSRPIPSVILMDIALRGRRTGIEVAIEITSRCSALASRIIFMTGWLEQFSSMIPDVLRQNTVLNKAKWTLEDLQSALRKAGCNT